MLRPNSFSILGFSRIPQEYATESIGQPVLSAGGRPTCRLAQHGIILRRILNCKRVLGTHEFCMKLQLLRGKEVHLPESEVVTATMTPSQTVGPPTHIVGVGASAGDWRLWNECLPVSHRKRGWRSLSSSIFSRFSQFDG